MKLAPILVLCLILPIVLLGFSARTTPPGYGRALPVAAIPSQEPEARPVSSEVTIEPGSRVGPLKLGDSRDRALELFPRKAEDQEWENSCGTTLDWVDAENPTGHGDLFIRLKKGKVFQIESSTTRFHTAEGITTFDHSEKVASRLQRPARLHAVDPARPRPGRPPARILDRQKKGHRLRVRLLSKRAQTLSLQDHRL